MHQRKVAKSSLGRPPWWHPVARIDRDRESLLGLGGGRYCPCERARSPVRTKRRAPSATARSSWPRPGRRALTRVGTATAVAALTLCESTADRKQPRAQVAAALLVGRTALRGQPATPRLWALVDHDNHRPAGSAILFNLSTRLPVVHRHRPRPRPVTVAQATPWPTRPRDSAALARPPSRARLSARDGCPNPPFLRRVAKSGSHPVNILWT